MKKNYCFFCLRLTFQILFCLYLFFGVLNINYIFADADIQKVRIIYPVAEVFDTPECVSKIADVSVKFNEVYEVEQTLNNCYKIEINETLSGYVQKYSCVDSSLKPIPTILDTNARLINDSQLYQKDGNSFIKIEGKILPNKTRVKILSGADKKDIYAKISYSEDDEIKTSYVLLKNIDADGVPLRSIIACMLIITCVAIFLIIYSFYLHSKKNKDKNNISLSI